MALGEIIIPNSSQLRFKLDFQVGLVERAVDGMTAEQACAAIERQHGLDELRRVRLYKGLAELSAAGIGEAQKAAMRAVLLNTKWRGGSKSALS